MAQNNPNNPNNPNNFNNQKQKQPNPTVIQSLSTSLGGAHAINLETVGQVVYDQTAKDNDVYRGYKKLDTAYDIARVAGSTIMGAKILADQAYNGMAESFNTDNVNALLKKDGAPDNKLLHDFSATFSSAEFYDALSTGTFNITDNNGNIIHKDVEAYQLRLKKNSQEDTYNDIADGKVKDILVDIGGVSQNFSADNIVLSINNNTLKNKVNSFVFDMTDDNSAASQTRQLISDSKRIVSLRELCESQKYRGSKQAVLKENTKIIENNLREAGLNRISRMSAATLNRIAKGDSYHKVKITESMRAQLLLLAKMRGVQHAYDRVNRAGSNRMRASERLLSKSLGESDLYRGFMTSLRVLNASKTVTKFNMKLVYQASRINIKLGKMRTNAINKVAAYTPGITGKTLSTVGNLSGKMNASHEKAVESIKHTADYHSKKTRKERRKNVAYERKSIRQGNRLAKRAARTERRRTRITTSKFGQKHPKLVNRTFRAVDKGKGLLKGVGKKFKSFFGLASKIKKWVKRIIIIAIAAVALLILLTNYLGNAFIMGMQTLGTLTSFFRNDDDDENELDSSIGNSAVIELNKEVFSYMDSVTDISAKNMPIYQSNKKGPDGSFYQITAPTETKYRLKNESGQDLSQTDYKNIKMIISLAEMHFNGEYTRSSYIEYCKELWDKTHTYTVSYGDVYYCDSKDDCSNWGLWYHSTPEECAASGLEGSCQLIPAVGDPNATALNPDSINYTPYVPEHYEPATCQGHEGCLGHVDMEVTLIAKTGDELIKAAGEMASYDKYHPLTQSWDYDEDRDTLDYNSPEDILSWVSMYTEQDWSEYGVYFGVSDMILSKKNASGGSNFPYAGGGVIPNGDVKSCYDTLINYYGFTPAGACGFLGNLQTESHLNPSVYDISAKKPFGIVQWMGGRKQAAIAYVSAQSGNPYDLAGQLDFAVSELMSKYPIAYQACISSSDPIYAAEAVCVIYEGCYYTGNGASHATSIYFGGEWQGLDSRRNNALSFYQNLAN